MGTYWQLLKDNPQLTKLWLAQVISLTGDWFNTVVLSTLVAQYTEGSGLAVSIFLMSRFLPPLLVSPIKGAIDFHVHSGPDVFGRGFLEPLGCVPALTAFGFFFVFGLVAVGWNGVFASEAARISPPGAIGHATGAVLFITFSGVLFGPVVFSLLFQVTGSYSATFIASTCLAALGVLFLGASRRATRAQ